MDQERKPHDLKAVKYAVLAALDNGWRGQDVNAAVGEGKSNV